MKSIELTKEHKSKLLEMCNKLFPEYKEIILTKQKFLNFGFKDHKSYTTRIGNMSIHWFEFCMTHLIQKIDNLHSEKILKPLENKACKEGYPDNGSEIWNERPWIKLWSLTNSGNYKKHPIDYLYEEFKKLKL